MAKEKIKTHQELFEELLKKDLEIKMIEDRISKCPQCGASIIWYRNPGVHRAVCSNKCQGFKSLIVTKELRVK